MAVVSSKAVRLARLCLSSGQCNMAMTCGPRRATLWPLTSLIRRLTASEKLIPFILQPSFTPFHTNMPELLCFFFWFAGGGERGGKKGEEPSSFHRRTTAVCILVHLPVDPISQRICPFLQNTLALTGFLKNVVLLVNEVNQR